jgi:aminoglycoside 3-N-acetyltransferase
MGRSRSDNGNPSPDTTSTVTRSDLERGLARLDVRAGHRVEVHSSLRAFGRVEGGAGAVIEALLNTVGAAGAIVMSAYPLARPEVLTPEERSRRLAWKCRVLPEGSTERTAMGAVVDAFKGRPDVVCGPGLHRVCAWGRDRERYRQGYAALVEDDGRVLLLGVGIDRCSSLHLADELPLPAAISACWEVPADVRRDYPDDRWSVGVGAGTPDDAWAKVYERADRAGRFRRARIGQADCHFFKARDVLAILAEWRRADPYGLYGVPAAPGGRTRPSEG